MDANDFIQLKQEVQKFIEGYGYKVNEAVGHCGDNEGKLSFYIEEVNNDLWSEEGNKGAFRDEQPPQPNIYNDKVMQLPLTLRAKVDHLIQYNIKQSEVIDILNGYLLTQQKELKALRDYIKLQAEDIKTTKMDIAYLAQMVSEYKSKNWFRF